MKKSADMESFLKVVNTGHPGSIYSPNQSGAELLALASPKMTEQQMLARIQLLGDEMDANDEENRAMQGEIDTLYAEIDAAKTVKN